MNSHIRAIMMPIAIILGILIPQANVLSFLQPYLIGLMMFLTFVSRVPPQKHGFTFRIEIRALASGLFLVFLLWLAYEFLGLPLDFLLAGSLLALCPPANAAPAMSRMLGGNPVLMLKIFIVGNCVACITIPLIFGFFTNAGSPGTYLSMALAIFNKMQPIISIPLALALGIRAFYPEVADKLVKFQKYTVMIWTLAVFIILSKASFDVRQMANLDMKIFIGMAVLAAVLCALLFALGWFAERGEHPIEASQSMGQKNTVLIILIAQVFAKDWPLVSLGPIWYVVWQNIVLSYMTAKVKPEPDGELPLK